jgi:hypothetical protein
MPTPSYDGIVSRNSTKVYIEVNGQRVGRLQSVREDITNNVQVLDELGRAFAVELKKGITHYSFSIARFYARSDVFDSLKLGQIFALSIVDTSSVDDTGAGQREVLEYFERCSITTISRDYTVGQAVVGENAQVVTIGQGIAVPGAA